MLKAKTEGRYGACTGKPYRGGVVNADWIIPHPDKQNAYVDIAVTAFTNSIFCVVNDKQARQGSARQAGFLRPRSHRVLLLCDDFFSPSKYRKPNS